VAVTPVITSLSEVQGGTNGGTNVKIVGTNFPKLGSTTPLEVLFGTAKAVIISRTPTLIVVESPVNSSGPLDVKVKVNGLESAAGTTFTYNSDNVVITTNSVSSASPVLKTDGKLVGTGFGTNKDDLEIVLTPVLPATNPTYSLLVWKLNALGTELDYTFIGGHRGTFKLSVKRKGYGRSNLVDFTYEIKVTGVTPLTGSIAGGTELTIAGANFSLDKLENNVFLGSVSGFDNKICHVTSVTTTQIKCLTPSGYDWQVDGQTNEQSIIVQGRLIEDADYYPGIYKFVYTSGAATPKIAKPTTTSYKSGDAVSITGSNLAANA
jgi:hypothetical protein